MHLLCPCWSVKYTTQLAAADSVVTDDAAQAALYPIEYLYYYRSRAAPFLSQT